MSSLLTNWLPVSAELVLCSCLLVSRQQKLLHSYNIATRSGFLFRIIAFLFTLPELLRLLSGILYSLLFSHIAVWKFSVSFSLSIISAATSGHLTASPWDSCSFVKGYADSHIKCHLSIFCMNCCSLIICSEVDFYLKVRVRECANPASVEVTYGWYGENPAYFKYVFEQSETVRNVSKQSNGDTRRYTGIVARNASHLGLEVLHIQYNIAG